MDAQAMRGPLMLIYRESARGGRLCGYCAGALSLRYIVESVQVDVARRPVRANYK
jgi:hypothetical protein